MNSKPSPSCNFNQPGSLTEQKGGSEGSPGRRRVVCAFTLLVFIFLNAPRIGWADENYFQIINDTSPAVNPDYRRDRGYALYVNYEEKSFLTDTGISKTSLVKNMKAAGILLRDLDFVFLSHRHLDHISGLVHIRSERPSLPIYIPPDGGFEYIRPKDLIEVTGQLRVSSNIFLIHTHDESGSAGVTDELSLLILTKKGPYLFTTNSHIDIFLKLEKAKRLAGQDIVFHSGHTARRVSRDETITAHAKKIKALNVKRVSPRRVKTKRAPATTHLLRPLCNT